MADKRSSIEQLLDDAVGYSKADFGTVVGPIILGPLRDLQRGLSALASAGRQMYGTIKSLDERVSKLEKGGR